MNREALKEAVAAWLRELGFEPDPAAEDGKPACLLPTKVGPAHFRVSVEKEAEVPLTLHFLARLPVTIPRQQFTCFAVHLMNLNRGIRYGRFILAADTGHVFYRLTHLLAGDQPVSQQCDFLMRQVLWYVESYSHDLHAMLTNEPDFDELCMRWATPWNRPIHRQESDSPAAGSRSTGSCRRRGRTRRRF